MNIIINVLYIILFARLSEASSSSLSRGADLVRRDQIGCFILQNTIEIRKYSDSLIPNKQNG